MDQADTARGTAERFLHAIVSEHPEDMADCYADDAVLEMPFAVELLYPARIHTTREQLRARFAAGAAVRRYTGLDEVAIHETTDPEVVVAEFEVTGHLVATGEPFTIPFLLVMTIREGRIVHSRDYTDPIIAARLAGRLPEVLASAGLAAG